MSYSDLPLEVRLQIVKYLDPSSFKSIRLVDRSVDLEAAAFLYHTVHLRPSRQSWRRLKRLASHPRFRHHVHTLHYHAGVLRQAMPKSSFRCHVHSDSLTWVHNKDVTEEIIHRWYKNYLARAHGQLTAKDVRTKYGDLTFLSQFTFLEQTICTYSVPEPHLRPYFPNREAFWHPEHQISDCYLETLWNLPVKHLTIRDFSWLKFPASPHPSRQPGISNLNLRSLEIHMSRKSSSPPQEHVQRAVAFLAQCEQLESLSFDADLNSVRLIDLPSSLLSQICRSGLESIPFVQLRHLKLSSVCLSRSFINLLQNHSSSLASLCLGNIRAEIVIDLFWMIADRCKLVEVSLFGFFTNMLDEAWIVGDEAQNGDSVRFRLEEYMCHRGPWPIADLCEYKAGRRLDRKKRLSLYRQAFTDESWVWSPDLLSR